MSDEEPRLTPDAEKLMAPRHWGRDVLQEVADESEIILSAPRLRRAKPRRKNEEKQT